MIPHHIYVMVYHQTLSPDDAEELGRAIIAAAEEARKNARANERRS
jgi:DNA-binding protein YbaB